MKHQFWYTCCCYCCSGLRDSLFETPSVDDQFCKFEKLLRKLRSNRCPSTGIL